MQPQFNYLVTGAGRDIGKAIAVELAREGSFAVLHYCNNSDGVDSTITEIREKGGDGIGIQADFRYEQDLVSFTASVRDALQGRGLDALIHNSAFTTASNEGDLEPGALRDVLLVNTLAPYLITDSLVENLNENSSIIALSIAATTKVFSPNFGFFAASKAALETLVMNWAVQFGPRKIRANAVAPGIVDVNFRSELLENKDFRYELEQNTALGRPGTPSDVASVVSSLISSKQRWITGQTVEASGGWKL
ncbi:MAG: SDR family oxidoreductase [Pseudomonadota bacterium]